MPFPFSLPTTSSLSISSFLRCETHPSLILAATTHRNVLRMLLKQHKKSSPASQSSNLSSLLNALEAYLPYIFAIDAGLCGNSVGDEEVDVTLKTEIDVAWQPCLSASSNRPGRDFRRINGKGFDYELCFVLHTLACVHSLLARKQLHTLYAATTPSSEERTKAIESATKHLLQAHSLHNSISNRASDTSPPQGAKDILPEVQSALASIALAEATLLAILGHDPYPQVVIQDRNKDDREWMYKAPDIPKVRAGLFVRLAVQAAEHASKAAALAIGTDEAFTKYIKNLQRATRAKACRFTGIEANLEGKVGQSIAWLLAGRKELGFKVTEESSKVKGFAKLKKNFSERIEDKKIEKGELWGADAGRMEEGRVNHLLEDKWHKENDMISNQLVPPSDPLASRLPTGREFYTPKPYVPPTLDEDVLAQMRAPLDPSELEKAEAQSDDDSDEGLSEAPGAYPGSSSHDAAYF